MNTENEEFPKETINVLQLARAVRFAMVGIVLPLCYFSLRGSLSIQPAETIFHDMLGGKPLPPLTQWAFFGSPVFILVSTVLPIVALSTLFMQNVVRSFYVLGGVGFVAVMEFIFLYHALTAPLFEIIRAMGGNP